MPAWKASQTDPLITLRKAWWPFGRIGSPHVDKSNVSGHLGFALT